MLSAGQELFGENRVQEARVKIPQITGASWHLIGSLQRNKVKEALRLFGVIHSVDTLTLAEEINRLENLADHIQRNAVAALFASDRNPIDVIKWKEIYETMEIVTDRCEDVANVIEGILLKMA